MSQQVKDTKSEMSWIIAFFTTIEHCLRQGSTFMSDYAPPSSVRYKPLKLFQHSFVSGGRLLTSLSDISSNTAQVWERIIENRKRSSQTQPAVINHDCRHQCGEHFSGYITHLNDNHCVPIELMTSPVTNFQPQKELPSHGVGGTFDQEAVLSITISATMALAGTSCLPLPS